MVFAGTFRGSVSLWLVRMVVWFCPSTGSYKINVVDGHEDEICEVVLVESSLENCKEIEIGRDRAQVLLANDGGISGKTRHANSLGFLRNEPLPTCAKLLKEYYGLGEEE
ncbi:Pollen-specific protein C13 [Dendrobium catenatum]|uniref:Pollen-specific protein C13 n=1 Tax=Dendrobium catenatum TaxID=906689 RepID=A0A2I0VJI7_9ASPA|nr:Pollen-specific protein C13 [Dendrobium catenatum]